MKTLTLAAFAAALLAGASAHATLLFSADVGGVPVLRCTDNQASTPLCPGGDTNPAVGTLAIPNGTFLGITVNGTVSTSTGTPGNPGSPDVLNTSTLNIINTTGSTQHIQAAVGDTSFAAPVTQADLSTSITAQLAIGSTVVTSFFDDPANVQGATNATFAPGTMLGSFTDTVAQAADAFAHSTVVPVSDIDPFSMTQTRDFSLVAGGQFVGNSQTLIKENAVPEPASLFLLGTALMGLGLAARRRRHETV